MSETFYKKDGTVVGWMTGTQFVPAVLTALPPADDRLKYDELKPALRAFAGDAAGDYPELIDRAAEVFTQCGMSRGAAVNLLWRAREWRKNRDLSAVAKVCIDRAADSQLTFQCPVFNCRSIGRIGKAFEREEKYQRLICKTCGYRGSHSGLLGHSEFRGDVVVNPAEIQAKRERQIAEAAARTAAQEAARAAQCIVRGASKDQIQRGAAQIADAFPMGEMINTDVVKRYVDDPQDDGTTKRIPIFKQRHVWSREHDISAYTRILRAQLDLFPNPLAQLVGSVLKQLTDQRDVYTQYKVPTTPPWRVSRITLEQLERGQRLDLLSDCEEKGEANAQTA
jgi:hypothetical protein